MALTQMDQTTFDQVIQGHKDVHQFITEQRTSISNVVVDASTQNKNQMVDSLVNVHADWDEKMGLILGDLETMIGNLETTKTKMMQQDVDNVIR
ncbi:hypothetical protein [Actinophytocola oryzae]|uniref:Uncharacterized protein n=1 Tax=Actinophytocola oryzae TaxID=502181 RepID=A0A4R7UQ91_9PSEU|nr:hypothetical protein [Actinophytocola oryzae]TDV34595.1 hypothetical protein CLV71_13810 [Actinophytocola oryzae]